MLPSPRTGSAVLPSPRTGSVVLPSSGRSALGDSLLLLEVVDWTYRKVPALAAGFSRYRTELAGDRSGLPAAPDDHRSPDECLGRCLARQLSIFRPRRLVQSDPTVCAGYIVTVAFARSHGRRPAHGAQSYSQSAAPNTLTPRPLH